VVDLVITGARWADAGKHKEMKHGSTVREDGIRSQAVVSISTAMGTSVHWPWPMACRRFRARTILDLSAHLQLSTTTDRSKSIVPIAPPLNKSTFFAHGEKRDFFPPLSLDRGTDLVCLQNPDHSLFFLLALPTSAATACWAAPRGCCLPFAGIPALAWSTERHP